VIVVNVSGTVRAFRAVCTHEGCPLGWNAQQHLIRCPCHGGAYDTSGRVVSGPPPAPLTELRAVVEHGSIYIVQAFDAIDVMTAGGPGSTNVPYFVYQESIGGGFRYGSASAYAAR